MNSHLKINNLTDKKKNTSQLRSVNHKGENS